VADKDKTYAGSGVDYSKLDPVKVLAQTRASQTAPNLSTFSAREVSTSRGESAYVWEEEGRYRALVVEGLGTKNLVADAVRKFSGKSHYDAIAQDAVAMIVNDLIVVGAMPQVINAYWAVGDSAWMEDKERVSDLINGWGAACQEVGAAWGGGETPTLKNIVDPATIDIGGAAIGVVEQSGRLVLGEEIEAGDVIVLIESSGIHANGLTLIRSLAEKDPNIYEHILPSGRTFGSILLSPTHLYVNLVRNVFEANLEVHYMVNITGHGWRKIMRANKKVSYVVHDVPPVPEEFEFIKERAQVENYEMYGNFNMGAGFAFILPEKHARQLIDIAKVLELKAWAAGTVEQASGDKEVVFTAPALAGLRFTGSDLGVR